MDVRLAANCPVQRCVDVLKLKPGEARDSEIEKVKTDYSGYDSKPSPDGVGAIAAAIEAFAKWAEDRAGLEDPSDLKRRIRGAGVLEFRILADRDSQSPANIASSDPSLKQAISIYTDRLQKVGPRARSGDRFRWLEIQDVEKFMRLDDIEDFDARQPGSQQIIDRYAGRYYVLAHNDSDYGMLRSKDRAKSRWSLRRSRVDQDPMTGEYLVRFTFDPRGGRLFGDFTGRNVQRQLCIVLDDEAVSHATLIQRIKLSEQLSGTGTAAIPGQRSHIAMFDATIQVNNWLSVGGVYGLRMSELDFSREPGDSVSSTAHFGVLRTDIHIVNNGDSLGEGRILHIEETQDTRTGALIGVYRHFGDNTKVGLGYNFTDFSDDLTDMSYDSQGVFLNIITKF